MKLLTSWLASPAPDAAVEISPERVSAAAIGSRGSTLVVRGFASEALPPGALAASLTAQNVVDRATVSSALRRVLETLGTRPSRVALVVPDVTAKISILRFEQVPTRREDLDQLVRWQVRKSAPFAIEDACVSYTPGARADGFSEYVVAMARRDIVREYEAVCDDAGVYAGLVDVATLSVVNLFLAETADQSGDALLVHVRPTYTSLAIMRGPDLIFFRNRAEGEDDTLTDLVHQTAMYYQDRLSGQGFSRVLLGGAGHASGALEAARASLEERLDAVVEPIDPTRSVTLTDRIMTNRDVNDVLSPLVGMLMRARRADVAA